jgi:hypothetical protein
LGGKGFKSSVFLKLLQGLYRYHHTLPCLHGNWRSVSMFCYILHHRLLGKYVTHTPKGLEDSGFTRRGWAMRRGNNEVQ